MLFFKLLPYKGASSLMPVCHTSSLRRRLSEQIYGNYSKSQMSDFPKLSYIHQVGIHPLRALTLGNLLEITANNFENREAIVSMNPKKRLTYKALLEGADKFAAGLQVLGVRKGDVLGIWAPNMVEWHVINMACARAGILLAAINAGNQAMETQYCINKVKIKIIVCPQYGKHHNYYNILHEIIPELNFENPRNLNSDGVPSLKNIIIISENNLSGTLRYRDVLELAGKDEILNIKKNQNLIQPDDACYIQFSSGTTGQPKAAMATHFQVVNGSFEIGCRNELNLKHHKICVQVPFFHVYGTTVCLAAALNFGATLVVGSSTYDPIANLRAIKEEKCTSVYGTPTMYVDLIKAQSELQLEINLEILLTSGAPCPPELFKRMRSVLQPQKIKVIYGFTEGSAVAFQSLPIHEDQFLTDYTVGYVADHIEVKIVDEFNNIVPLGTPGELCLRGYAIMLGYLGDEEKTKASLGDDGWFKTGDQLILQENGYGRIVGRLKDVIIRGGENIFPKEVEDVLVTNTNVLEAQVIGVPHERLGEEVCACVILKEGADLTLNSMVAFLKGRISFSKIPSRLKILRVFPKTLSGKIKKFELVKEFENL